MNHLEESRLEEIRSRLCGVKALMSAMVLCASVGSFAQTTLSLAHGAAEDNPRHLAALKLAENVNKASGGRITIKVSPASKSGDDASVLGKAARGELDLTANSQGAVAQVVPEFAALGMPYLFRSQYEVWKTLSGTIGDTLAKKSEEKGFVLLGMWDNGFRQMTNSKRPIRRPEDLKGMLIRTPPDAVTMELITALGGTPKVVPFGELPAALKDGKVDGQENPLVNIYSAQLHLVQKYLTLTNHKYESTPLLMSKMSWEKLSANDRKILREAAAEATYLQRDLMSKGDERTFTRLAKTDIIINNIYEVDPFVVASRSVMTKWEAGPIGPFVKEVYGAVGALRANEKK